MNKNIDIISGAIDALKSVENSTVELDRLIDDLRGYLIVLKFQDSFGIETDFDGEIIKPPKGLNVFLDGCAGLFCVLPYSPEYSEKQLEILNKFKAAKCQGIARCYDQTNGKAVYDALIAEFGYDL